MSDISATNGVAHVVADVIPTTDLGTNSDQIQNSFFGFIDDVGISSRQENFHTGLSNVNDISEQFVKSVDDVGSTLSAVNAGVPQISGLYQTPVDNSASLANAVTQSNQAPPDQVSAGFGVSSPPGDGFEIGEPHATGSVPDLEQNIQITDHGLNSQTFTNVPEAGPGIGFEFDNSNNIQSNVILATSNPVQSSTEINIGIQSFVDANTFPSVGVPLPAVSFDTISPPAAAPSPPSSFGTPGSVPSVLTLYSTPNLSPEERQDPFTSQIDPQFLRTGTQNNVAGSLQKALLNDLSAINAQPQSNTFITIPEFSNIANPFDLSQKSNFETFKNEMKKTFPESFPSDDHESFFVITRGDVNLQEIIDKLDENIRKDIHLVDSPSVFFNNSVTKLALKKSLPESLINQIREILLTQNSPTSNVQTDPIFVHLQGASLENKSNNEKLKIENNTNSFSEPQGREIAEVSRNSSENFNKKPETEQILAISLPANNLSKNVQEDLPSVRLSLPIKNNGQIFGKRVNNKHQQHNITNEVIQKRNQAVAMNAVDDQATLTHKSLNPTAGLVNSLHLQNETRLLQEEKISVRKISDAITTDSPVTDSSTISDFTDATEDSIAEMTTEAPIESETFSTTTELTESATEVPLLSKLLEGEVEKIKISDLLGEELVPTFSHEQELNVIEFLRQQNLTAFADMLELTGLNRDLLRGGELYHHSLN